MPLLPRPLPLAVAPLLLLVACDGLKESDLPPDLGGTPAAAVAATTDTPLVRSTVSPDPGVAATGPGLKPASAGLPLTQAPFFAGVDLAPFVALDAAPLEQSADDAVAPAPLDATVDFVATIGVETSGFPEGDTPTLAALAPYDALTVTTPSLALDTAVTPLAPGALVVTATSTVDPTIVAESAPLPTSPIVLRQVTEMATPAFLGQAAGDGDGFYFTGVNAQGAEKLFVATETMTDPLAARQVLDLSGPLADDQLWLFGEFLGDQFLAGVSEAYPGRRLYRYDASADRVDSVLDVLPGADLAPADLVELGGDLYFTAVVPPLGVRKVLRYRADAVGNPLEVRQISQTAGLGGNDAPAELVVAEGKLYFSAAFLNGKRKLFRFDPVAGTLRQVIDLAPGQSDDPRDLTPADGGLYLTLRHSAGGRKVFFLDDASGGLFRVADLRGTTAISDQAANLVAADDRLFFTAIGSSGVRELFAFDPQSGLLRCPTSTAGPGVDAQVLPLATSGDDLYFTALVPEGGRKLFVFDEDGVHQVVDLTGNPAVGDGVLQLVEYEGRMWFGGANVAGARKLYALDPSSGAVTLAADLAGDPLVSDAVLVAGVGLGRLHLLARAASGALELFRVCDPNAGCVD